MSKRLQRREAGAKPAEAIFSAQMRPPGLSEWGCSGPRPAWPDLLPSRSLDRGPAQSRLHACKSKRVCVVAWYILERTMALIDHTLALNAFRESSAWFSLAEYVTAIPKMVRSVRGERRLPITLTYFGLQGLVRLGPPLDLSFGILGDTSDPRLELGDQRLLLHRLVVELAPFFQQLPVLRLQFANPISRRGSLRVARRRRPRQLLLQRSDPSVRVLESRTVSHEAQ